MIDIDIRGIAEVQRLFRGLASDQIDYALTVTLNGTAFATQKVGRSQLESSFNRPTPLIKGSTRVDKATKETLTARVFIDPKRAAIIMTHEEGGQLFYVSADISTLGLTAGQAIRFGNSLETAYVQTWPGTTTLMQINPYVSAQVGMKVWKWA